MYKSKEKLTSRHRRAVISVAGDIDGGAGAAGGARDPGAGVAAAARRAAARAQLEPVVTAHAASQLQAR